MESTEEARRKKYQMTSMRCPAAAHAILRKWVFQSRFGETGQVPNRALSVQSFLTGGALLQAQLLGLDLPWEIPEELADSLPMAMAVVEEAAKKPSDANSRRGKPVADTSEPFMVAFRIPIQAHSVLHRAAFEARESGLQGRSLTVQSFLQGGLALMTAWEGVKGDDGRELELELPADTAELLIVATADLRMARRARKLA